MSRRGQVDLTADEKADSPFPVRRSSRISSGQNVTSSPAPKAIKSRRSSANSITEKNGIEDNTSPKRKTRRTSTDEDPKPLTTRSRRSSISRVIEEEKPALNSPSRRNTRQSSTSPSLDVPARRTRRSSQDTETVDVPARRTTRRSSTGIQESTIEEIIEQAKPITRRRRSSSIDEQEEISKTESTRPKTKRLFNEDNQLEPIKEQDQEVKEKKVSEENTHKLEVVLEISDEETEKIIEDLKDALEESSPAKNLPEKSITEMKDTIENENPLQDTSNETLLQNSNEMDKTVNNIMEKKGNLDIEELEKNGQNEEKAFSSPGSDKENSSVNIPKKRLSTKLIEENSSGIISEQNVFTVKTISSNSFYEPMEIDDDEEDVFVAQSQSCESIAGKPTEDKATEEKDTDSSKTQMPEKLIINGKSFEEDEGIETEGIVPSKTLTPKRTSMNRKPAETDEEIEEVTSSKILTPKQTSIVTEEDNEIKNKVEYSEISTLKETNINEEENEEIGDKVSSNPEIHTPTRLSLKPGEEDKERENETTPPSQIFSPKRISMGGKSKECMDKEDDVTAASKTPTSQRISISENSSKEKEEIEKENKTLSKIATPKRKSLNVKPIEEDEVRALSKSITPKRTSLNRKLSGEDKEIADSNIERLSVNRNCNEENETEIVNPNVSISDQDASMNCTTKDHNYTMEGSFSKLNSSGSDYTVEEKAINPTPEHSVSFKENKTSLSDDLKETNVDDDTASDTSIKLVDTDEEDEITSKMDCVKEKNDLIEIEKLNVSVLDQSFNSEEPSVIEETTCNIVIEDSVDEVICISTTEEKMDTIMNPNDEEKEEMNKSKDNSQQRRSLTKRKLVLEQESDSTTKSQSINDDSQLANITNTESNRTLSSLIESKDSPNKIQNMPVEILDDEDENITQKSEKNSKETGSNQDKINFNLDTESDNDDVIDINDSCSQLSSVNDDKESGDIKNATIDLNHTNISTNSINIKNREVDKSFDDVYKDSLKKEPKTEKLTPSSRKSLDGKSEISQHSSRIETNETPTQKIIFQSVEMVHPVNKENSVQEFDNDNKLGDQENKPQVEKSKLGKRKTRHSMPSSLNENDQESDDEQVEKVGNIKSRLSLPSRQHNVSKTLSQKKTNQGEKSICEDQVEENSKKSRISTTRLSVSKSIINEIECEKSICEEKNQVEENSKIKRISTTLLSVSKPIISETESEKSICEETNQVEENSKKKRISSTSLSVSKPIISETESASEGISNAISSSDDDNNTMGDDELNSSIESEKEEEKSIVTISNKPKSAEKKNVELRTVSCKEESEEKGKRLRRSKFKKEQLEIITRSGIEVEDDVEVDDLLDDMAEEDGTLGDEESDENEIKYEGELVMSSDSEKNSTDGDNNDSKDSFINDVEEEELLSGEEDFLEEEVVKTCSKKYKRIKEPSISDSDEAVENEKSSNPSLIPAIKVVSVDEEKNEESQQNIEKDKSFEEQLDSVLKTKPVDVSTPNQTINEAMNTSVISESSVILQETCSVGAAKNKIILNRINNMVDVFCKSINEPEGNISLNVSLNYIPPSTSTVTSVETRNSLNISLEESTPLTRNADPCPEDTCNQLSELTKNEEVSTTDSQKISEDKQDLDKTSENIKVSSQLQKESSLVVDDQNEVSNKTKKSKKKKSKTQLDSPPKKIEAVVNEQKKKSLKRPADCVTTVTKGSDDIKSHIKKKKKLMASEESIQKASLVKGKVKKVAFETNVSDSKDKTKKSKIIPEPIIGKKKVKYDETVEAKPSTSSEIKKKGKTVGLVQEDIQQKKKEKRKHSEPIEQDTVNKKLKTEDKKQTKTKNQQVKEIRPTKPSSQSVGQTEWDEEVVTIKPSAASSSKSGFNLEKLMDRDFKNRMIYDSSRNKREPISKTRKHKK